MKEILLSKDEYYKFLLLMEGFVISFFYNEELINPGTPVVLKVKLFGDDDKPIRLLCSCVSHNGGRLVLI